MMLQQRITNRYIDATDKFPRLACCIHCNQPDTPLKQMYRQRQGYDRRLGPALPPIHPYTILPCVVAGTVIIQISRIFLCRALPRLGSGYHLALISFFMTFNWRVFQGSLTRRIPRMNHGPGTETEATERLP
jgi:hypothetical protein